MNCVKRGTFSKTIKETVVKRHSPIGIVVISLSIFFLAKAIYFYFSTPYKIANSSLKWKVSPVKKTIIQWRYISDFHLSVGYTSRLRLTCPEGQNLKNFSWRFNFGLSLWKA